MKRLENKVAVITGGNSGIGLATAKEFIAQGAKVVITGRNSESIAKAAEELGENAFGIVSDVSSMNDIKSLSGLIQENFSKIDILFINVGIAQFAPIGQVTEEFYDQSMNTNLKGSYFTIQALLPLINDGGSIILNTSINAHLGVAGASVYAATKAALLSLAKNLSAELLGRKIRVNAISPGPVRTPLHTAEKFGISNEQLAQMGAGILTQIPVGRFGTAEEIAKAALYFASDDSGFVLGAELIIDGGMSTL
jgi:NAD(P)-dependent dehydrogenase (short-subunit alcohol dehydrogenase family)